MAYTINRYNGEQTSAITVEDGTINSTLDIRLIGKNYSGYGEPQNENYVWLLENFARDISPSNAITGQLWYDTSLQKLKVNNGVGKWRTLGVIEGVTSNSSAKIADLQPGDFFWNSTTEELYCKTNTTPVFIGGKQTGIRTQVKPSTVIDSNYGEHEIAEVITGDVTTFVISSESSEFVLSEDEELFKTGDWTTIFPGITAKGIDDDSLTSLTWKYNGTATDSDRLNGVLSTGYVNQASPVFSNIAKFSDGGLKIGLSELLTLNVQGSIPTLTSKATTITFNTTLNNEEKTPMKLVNADILPGTNNTSNIGSDTIKFNTVYATTFNGTATQANGLTLGGSADGKIGSVDPDSDTVAVRTSTDEAIILEAPSDTTGSLKATYFIGNSFLAGQADLAEKYLADATYDVGTVVMIGGTAEITATQTNYRAIGVVSGNPATIMNAKLVGGTIVALKGRVPVKVTGVVKKGDRLISADNGAAKAFTSTDDSSLVFAIAIESNESNNLTTIEALVL